MYWNNVVNLETHLNIAVRVRHKVVYGNAVTGLLLRRALPFPEVSPACGLHGVTNVDDVPRDAPLDHMLTDIAAAEEGRYVVSTDFVSTLPSAPTLRPTILNKLGIDLIAAIFPKLSGAITPDQATVVGQKFAPRFVAEAKGPVDVNFQEVDVNSADEMVPRVAGDCLPQEFLRALACPAEERVRWRRRRWDETICIAYL